MSSTHSHGRKVFVVGPGFLGWNIIEDLVAEGYQVSALVRRPEARASITKLNAEPIVGELHNHDLIAKHVFLSDVVIHSASADDMPSVKAVLDGITQRAEKELPTIYLHTSGAANIDDGAAGEYKGEKIYSDERPQEIDALPDSAPHRNVDLEILKVRKAVGHKAKIAIMTPPLIYGFWPENPRVSIQAPFLTRFAIKNGFAGYVGKGLAVTSGVHVRDLAKAYVTVLHHLEKTPGSSPDLHNPYYFTDGTGDNEISWGDLAAAIGEGLHKAGRIKDAKPRSIPRDLYKDLFGDATDFLLGLNSRTRADRLHKLGWKPTHKGWRESFLEDELPFILQE